MFTIEVWDYRTRRSGYPETEVGGRNRAIYRLVVMSETLSESCAAYCLVLDARPHAQ